MSVDARLQAVKTVEIDEGVFKYILIKVYGKENPDGSELNKIILRGWARATWHGMYQKLSR